MEKQRRFFLFRAVSISFPEIPEPFNRQGKGYISFEVEALMLQELPCQNSWERCEYSFSTPQLFNGTRSTLPHKDAIKH
jgi:hypothetical protein